MYEDYEFSISIPKNQKEYDTLADRIDEWQKKDRISVEDLFLQFMLDVYKEYAGIFLT